MSDHFQPGLFIKNKASEIKQPVRPFSKKTNADNALVSPLTWTLWRGWEQSPCRMSGTPGRECRRWGFRSRGTCPVYSTLSSLEPGTLGVSVGSARAKCFVPISYEAWPRLEIWVLFSGSVPWLSEDGCPLWLFRSCGKGCQSFGPLSHSSRHSTCNVDHPSLNDPSWCWTHHRWTQSQSGSCFQFQWPLKRKEEYCLCSWRVLNHAYLLELREEIIIKVLNWVASVQDCFCQVRVNPDEHSHGRVRYRLSPQVSHCVSRPHCHSPVLALQDGLDNAPWETRCWQGLKDLQCYFFSVLLMVKYGHFEAVSAVIIFQRDIGTMLEEKTCHFVMTLSGGQVKRRRPVPVSRINFCATLKKCDCGE